MARIHIATATILERHRRLDGAEDMLVELALADGTARWVAIRETEDKLTGSWEVEARKPMPAKGLGLIHPPQPQTERRFVSVPKRRTLKAGVADLVEQVPALLHATKNLGNSAYWALGADDRRERERQFRADREWRLHELTTWPDGRFLARLSCGRHPQLSTGKCQVVVESVWGDGRVSAQGDWGSKRIDGIESREMLAALADRLRRYKLPELLTEVDNGFAEEREAKAAFERMAKSRLGGRHQDFGVPNAVRGAGLDRETEIEVVEPFEGHRCKAFLLNTGRGWFVMEVATRGLGNGPMARFVDVWTGDTAFDTPVATARAILARTDRDGFSEEQARAQLRQLVLTDIEWRWHSESVSSSGTWLITAVAELSGGRLAVRGACVFPAAELLPIPVPRPVWRIVVTGMTETDQHELSRATIIDMVTGKPIPIVDEPDVERFRAAVGMLGGKGMAEARQVIEGTVLRRAKGFTSHAAADEVWDKLIGSGAAIMEVDGDVDPVPPAITRLQLDMAHQERRARIEADLEGEERTEALARLAKARKTEWPARLLEVLAEEFPGHDGGEAPGVPFWPDETGMDDLAVADEGAEVQSWGDRGEMERRGRDEVETAPAAAGNAAADETGVDVSLSQPDETAVVDPSPKRRGGRQRVHEDDKARKRKWAQKKRAEAAAARDPAAPKNKGGRPRKYASQAERQKAYEARKKLVPAGVLSDETSVDESR